jgi:hypothetical protein
VYQGTTDQPEMQKRIYEELTRALKKSYTQKHKTKLHVETQMTDPPKYEQACSAPDTVFNDYFYFIMNQESES